MDTLADEHGHSPSQIGAMPDAMPPKKTPGLKPASQT
jgi:hypothetical protein